MKPAYQVLADDLRAQIVSGHLRPGQRLPTEPQLCTQSGVSRSTVREALRLLASQHLIVTVRGVNGGSFVAEPSPSKLADMLAEGLGRLLATGVVSSAHVIEVRVMIEVPAAELAARHRTEAHLARLDAAMFDPVADTVARKLAVHRDFHLAVAAATGNPVLELVCEPLYITEDHEGLSGQLPLPFWRRIDEDHRGLVGAIRRQDPAEAGAAARAHLDHLRTV